MLRLLNWAVHHVVVEDIWASWWGLNSDVDCNLYITGYFLLVFKLQQISSMDLLWLTPIVEGVDCLSLKLGLICTNFTVKALKGSLKLVLVSVFTTCLVLSFFAQICWMEYNYYVLEDEAIDILHSPFFSSWVGFPVSSIWVTLPICCTDFMRRDLWGSTFWWLCIVLMQQVLVYG
jgi:hypothetical protein